MNKTLLALLVTAALGIAVTGCSSDDDPAGTPTAAGTDPVTGGPFDDAGVPGDASTAVPTDASSAADAGSGNGAAADPATDGAPTREPSFGPAQLSPANLDAVVAEVFGIYTGAAYGAEVLALPPYPGLRNQSVGDSPYYGSTASVDTCENGGTARLAMDWEGARVITYDRRGAFDDCQLGGLVIDGEIQLLDTDNVSVASSGLTVTDGAEVRSFSGGVAYGDGNNYGGSSERYWTASELSWTVRDGDYTDHSITDANTRYLIDGGYGRSVSGGFTLLYGGTGGAAVRVDTPVAFEADGPSYVGDDNDASAWRFRTGTLRLVADDGSSVLVEADNGDPDSARVTLSYAGEVETFDKPWSDWDAPLRAGPSPTR